MHFVLSRVVAERLRAPSLSSVVSDQQCVGSSPGRGFLWARYFTIMALSFDGTLSGKSRVLALVVHVQEPRTRIVEEKRLTLVFLVHMASTLVYRFSQACELQ